MTKVKKSIDEQIKEYQAKKKSIDQQIKDLQSKKKAQFQKDIFDVGTKTISIIGIENCEAFLNDDEPQIIFKGKKEESDGIEQTQ